MRKLRSDFMVNISKCFQTGEIDKYGHNENMKAICEQIVKTASSHVDPELQAKLKHVIFQDVSNDTLKKEHEALGNFNMK